MAAELSQVRWGQYLNYEGPWFAGVQKLPPDATGSAEEKVVAVIAATEGSAFDAVNMYDRCVMTVGVIQFCDAGQFSVTDMLGAVAEASPTALVGLNAYVATRQYSFGKTPRGRWRFTSPAGEVDTSDEQRTLYLANSNGHLGTWDAESKAWARGFVVAMASVWDDPYARAAQLRFTYEKLPSFVFGPGRELFQDAAAAQMGLDGAELAAARAAYFSFAANNPTIASNQFAAWRKTATTKGIGGLDFLVGLLRTLTFAPKIAIYPGRYDKIAPVLRKLWGIDIPKTAAELGGASVSSAPSVDRLPDTKTLQKALEALGFDIGPKGPDGIYGTKTRGAVVQFQSQNALVADGLVGPKTAAALIDALRKKKLLNVIE